MATNPIEVAEEALEDKLTELKIDGNEESSEQKGAKEQSPKKSFFRNDEERRRVWEEAQKTKNPVSAGHKGTVKWYSILGRYGFIERDDDKTDVFVHQSGISKSKAERCFLRTLAEKETVEFDLVQGEKGLEAVNVTGPGGVEVQGSKAFRILLHRPERKNYREHANKLRSKKPREGMVEEEEGKTDAPKTERRRRNPRGHKKNAKAKADSDEEVRGGSRRRANSGAGEVEAPGLDKSECARGDDVPSADEIAA